MPSVIESHFRPMRIGFDATPITDYQSGVGAYTSNLLAHLCQQIGPEDEIVAMSHRPSTLSRQRPARAINKTLWMQGILPGQLRQQQIDLCHFTNSVATLFSPCPMIVTIHDMTLWLAPQHHYLRRLLAMRPLIPWVVRRAAAIIAVSQTTKADLVRILKIPPEKVHVIHEAPATCFRPLSLTDPSLAATRQRLRLPTQFILYVGTIEPRKNLVRLLEAFARLWHGRVIAQKLLLVGQRGWKDEAVFCAIERLQLQAAVRYLGYVSQNDLVALYNLADLLAFPSLYEGFGLPVIEAMACGTPVLTACNSALGEIAGEAAELINPYHVESIAAGLQTVLTSSTRRAELRSKGQARAAQFSWAYAAQQTHMLYRQIAAHS